MFGLAALAALMAMAFVGATSAMAESTALCSVDENPCATSNQIGSVHEESVGKAQFASSAGTIRCNTLFSGIIGTKLASPLIISGSFSYTSCELGGSSCVMSEENGPIELKVLREGHETAKVTYENLIHIKCNGFIDCSYAGTLVGTAHGPLLSTQTNGEITFSGQALNKEPGGFLCPSKLITLSSTTAPLSATYIST